MRKIAYLLSAMLFACMTLAAAAKTTPAASQSANRARPSDAEIDRVIRIKLAKSKIGKDGFTAHVKGGVVTWEGSTNVIQHKGAATRMAKTAGAIQVINNIKISDAAREKAAGNFGTASRRVLVKNN